MTGGDLVTVALPGDLGKPRPALVIQSNAFAGTGTTTLLPLSGTFIDAPSSALFRGIT
jgi:mRNA interferase MazF